jgi:RNA polymerase sigma-70 factor (ECF subfamily)
VDGISESELLRDARRGDEAAFLEIYERHRTPIFRFAWRLTGSQAAAEDIVQECFLALLKGTAFREREGALRSYLFGIARHLAMRRLQAAEREAVVIETVDGNDPLRELLDAEAGEVVGRAIAALPLPQKEALILFEYEELSLEEIAAIAGVDTGAVKSRLFRAREALKRRLAPYAERSCS